MSYDEVQFETMVFTFSRATGLVAPLPGGWGLFGSVSWGILGYPGAPGNRPANQCSPSGTKTRTSSGTPRPWHTDVEKERAQVELVLAHQIERLFLMEWQCVTGIADRCSSSAYGFQGDGARSGANPRKLEDGSTGVSPSRQMATKNSKTEDGSRHRRCEECGVEHWRSTVAHKTGEVRAQLEHVLEHQFFPPSSPLSRFQRASGITILNPIQSRIPRPKTAES